MRKFLLWAFRLFDASKSNNFTNHGDSSHDRKYIPKVSIRDKVVYTAANT